MTNPLILAGMPRTGTSWAGKALGFARGYTYFREPDNFDHVEGATGDFPFLYVTAGDADHEAYRRHMERALSGEIATPFTMKEDAGPLLSWLPQRRRNQLGKRFPILYAVRSNLVAKLVNSNLALDWILGRFPDAWILYIFRHPCGQFASFQRQGWEPRPERYLQDATVLSEHLAPFEDTIRRAATFWERAGAQWGLINRIVYQQALQQDRLAMIPYEWLCSDPVVRFKEIYAWAGLEWNEAVENFLSAKIQSKMSDDPYSLAKDPAVQIDRWRKYVSERDIYECRSYSEAFKLPLYGNFDPYQGSPVWPRSHLGGDTEQH